MRLCFKEFIYLLSFKVSCLSMNRCFCWFGEIMCGQNIFFSFKTKNKLLRGFPVSICTVDHDRLPEERYYMPTLKMDWLNSCMSYDIFYNVDFISHAFYEC